MWPANIFKIFLAPAPKTLLTTGLGPPQKKRHVILRVTDMSPFGLPPCITTQLLRRCDIPLSR